MPGSNYDYSKAFLATGSTAYAFGELVKPAVGATLQPAQCARVSAITDFVLGVAQENLDVAKVLTGKAYIGVALEGAAKVIFDGGTVPAIGDYMTIGSTTQTRVKRLGTQPANGGAFQGFQVVGICFSVPAVAGDIFDIWLTPAMRV
jgi:hypothetical protein